MTERTELLDLHPIILDHPGGDADVTAGKADIRSMSGCVTRDLQPRRYREHVLDAALAARKPALPVGSRHRFE